MGFFSDIASTVKALKVGNALIDIARAGDLAGVVNLIDSTNRIKLHPKNRADLLALGLIEAAVEGHAQIVQLLLEEGANINQRHKYNGETALAIATFNNREKVIEVLLIAGADVNIPNNDGVTPLMFASAKCSLRVVRHMLKAGADVSAISSDGATAIEFANFCPNVKTVLM